jgi:hypothetical protein
MAYLYQPILSCSSTYYTCLCIHHSHVHVQFMIVSPLSIDLMPYVYTVHFLPLIYISHAPLILSSHTYIVIMFITASNNEVWEIYSVRTYMYTCTLCISLYMYTKQRTSMKRAYCVLYEHLLQVT